MSNIISDKYRPIRCNDAERRRKWGNPSWFGRIQTKDATRRWRKLARYDGMMEIDEYESNARSLIGWRVRYYW